jgi:hypothetical protein
LLTAHAGLEGVIRHKTNRTLIGKFGYEFLPSLNASPSFSMRRWIEGDPMGRPYEPL